MSFHILGRRVVIIDKPSVAEDLLTRRALIYSDRHFPPMGGELMKREHNMFYIAYNDRFKTYRRLLHREFNPSAVKNFWSTQQSEARSLVSNICQADSENLFVCVQRAAASLIMKISFGYTIDNDNDHFVFLAESSLKLAYLAGAPGRWLVDSFPILRFLPDWFPGADFKRKAKIWGRKLDNLSIEPHHWAQKQMVSGTAEPSFTSRLLNLDDERERSPDYDDIVRHTAGSLYAAGVDTLAASMKVFFYAMTCNPEIQRKAQEEVDSVTSAERRLPTLEDRASMPYLECILKEVLRWAPPAPMGLAHCSSSDDVYKGYFIPAKTSVYANIWAMTHDEDEYPDPYLFNPDRFLAKEGERQQKDPRGLVYGFGRRLCPGSHFAEFYLFIQMATCLAILDVFKDVDCNGVCIDPKAEFSTGLTTHMAPFPCIVKPRSRDSLAMIQNDHIASC
ncbi:cytochrome P450 [Crucibulum laeve]|uniref:Cytochrome P450 n=1 Tax=Crucibulum laeve TaxID=68775 RepID=A0A5C3LGP9_9AGAR|nr:cytochrome P450 [Crucibulum laeve]